MTNETMTKNQDFITKNLEKFLNLYKNKYVLIYDQEVVGSYDSYDVAAEEGIKAFGIKGDFLVHYVTEVNPVNFVSTAML